MADNSIYIDPDCVQSITDWFDAADDTEFEDFKEVLEDVCNSDATPKEKAEQWWRWLASKLI